MKLYLKVIGYSCYTCLPRSSPAAAQKLQKMVAPDTCPKAQRLLTIATPKHGPTHTHTCKQGQKIRNSTTLHKTALKTMLELFYALQRSRGYKERLKRSYNAKPRLKNKIQGPICKKTGGSKGFCAKTEGLNLIKG
jgi:hypothetical protein